MPRVAGYRSYSRRDIPALTERFGIDKDLAAGIDLAAAVFPFKTNEFVLTEMIDWKQLPDDPMFRLSFPHPDMLSPETLQTLRHLDRQGASREQWRQTIRSIHRAMNPHPGDQITRNAPFATETNPGGIQHKYAETVLFFPPEGQTCHAYCSFCFRWPQFVGDRSMRFSDSDTERLIGYLAAHPDVRDVILTGGDPLFMSSARIEHYLQALSDPRVGHVDTIRLGTKALTYWPQRFLGTDGDSLLKTLTRAARDRNIVVMAHLAHPAELRPDAVRQAIRRLISAGIRIYCQGPILRPVNASSASWHELWTAEVKLGCIPYYMFIARDTGARHYFQLPIETALTVFQEAYMRLPGLARTVRGPVMSASEGKVVVDGYAFEESALSLRYLQARDPRMVGQCFYAHRDGSASWLDELAPVNGYERFF
jgi:KamA family protein